MSGFFHAQKNGQLSMAKFSVGVKRNSDCPVCRAFFMQHLWRQQIEITTDAHKEKLIARLCRTFFMHNCINFGINNGVNKNHLIFVLLMSVFIIHPFHSLLNN